MLVHNVLTPRPQPTLSKGSYEIEFGITFVAIRPFRTYFVTTNTTKLLFIVNFFGHLSLYFSANTSIAFGYPLKLAKTQVTRCLA